VLARAEKVRSKSFLTNAMTIAQQLIEEGRVEGREEGRQEGGILGRQQSILLCLEIRFGELPDTIRSQITAVKSIAKLESILSTAIHSSSLEQIALSLR
jgi:predicted transposase YdaD